MSTGRLQFELKITSLIGEVACVFLLMVAYLVNIQLLVVVAFGLACVLLFFSNDEDSITTIAFLTSFAKLYVYSGKSLFFVLVGVFIFKFLFNRKVRVSTFVFYVILFVYCILFYDANSRISFANVMGLVFLFAIPIIGEASCNIDCKKLMQHYILGFFISTCVGFVSKQIPSMSRLFEYDLVWSTEHPELTRFCGLAFDSNFYALSNYTIVAYLLLAFRKLNKYRVMLVFFFVVAGLQTVSKSYVLIIALIAVVYLMKTVTNFKQLAVSLVAVGLGSALFILISQKVGYNVIELVTNRFVLGGSVAENTTGRFEIWTMYFDTFANASMKELLFGHGFNAVVARAAHNTFIEFLYLFGVIGCILWLCYFAYCGRLCYVNTRHFQNKTSMVFICFFLGIFFLSAYTFEAFWFGMFFSFLTFKRFSKVRFGT